MGRKLIFLDIDGTLTKPGCNEPPESALRAIRMAQRQGHKVFLCTGRNYGMLKPLLKYGFDGFISSSGGYIVCGREEIYDCPMTEEQKHKAMDILKENGIYRTVECRDGAFTDEAFKEFLQGHAGEGGNSELLRWRRQLEDSLNIQPMANYQDEPIYKIVMMCHKIEQMETARELLGEEFSFCVQEPDSYGFINGEMLNKSFDKGQGVRRICRCLGVSLENTVAFGDSMNDWEMMETAALSICMDNGSQALKKLADAVCPSVEEDGIYTAFARYHLLDAC